MSRAYTILTPHNRAALIAAIEDAPDGYRVEIAEPQRSDPQNRLMWVLLQNFADQVEHYGRHYGREEWKAILMKAFGKAIEFVPSLDGLSVVAIGYRSSKLSKEEMSHFIEFIYAEGAHLGVAFDRELTEPAKALSA